MGRSAGGDARARLVGWGLGLIAGLAVAAVIPESLFPGSRPPRIPVPLLLVSLVAGESPRTAINKTASEDERLPDGKVEIAKVEGMVGEPNPVDPRGPPVLFVSRKQSEISPAAFPVSFGTQVDARVYLVEFRASFRCSWIETVTPGRRRRSCAYTRRFFEPVSGWRAGAPLERSDEC